MVGKKNGGDWWRFDNSAANSNTPQPPTPREQLPPCPGRFNDLANKSEDYLWAIHGTPQLISDLALKAPEAVKLCSRIQEVNEDNKLLAAEIKGKQMPFKMAMVRARGTQTDYFQRKDRVEVVAVKLREKAVSQLKASAEVLDKQAKDLFQEGIKGAEMDSASLAVFRDEFLKRKAEMHRHKGLGQFLEGGS